MLAAIISPIVPIAFVIALGYAAGLIGIVDRKHSDAFAKFVLEIALPILLFVVVMQTDLSNLVHVEYVLAFAIGLMGFYAIAFALHRLLFRRPVHQAAQAAFVCSFPDMAALGIPVFTQLLSSTALISVVIGNLITSVLMIPLTIILLESGRGRGVKAGSIFLDSLLQLVRKPLIVAPALAVCLVALGVELPALAARSLHLIGDTTSGVSLFALGLTMSRFPLVVTRVAGINIALKNLVHQALMMAIVALVGLSGLLSREIILLCAMPTAVTTTMFAVRYDTLVEESTSSTILGTILAILTLPVFIYLVGAGHASP